MRSFFCFVFLYPFLVPFTVKYLEDLKIDQLDTFMKEFFCHFPLLSKYSYRYLPSAIQTLLHNLCVKFLRHKFSASFSVHYLLYWIQLFCFVRHPSHIQKLVDKLCTPSGNKSLLKNLTENESFQKSSKYAAVREKLIPVPVPAERPRYTLLKRSYPDTSNHGSASSKKVKQAP